MKPFLIDYFIDRESFIDLQIDFLKQDFFYSMNQDDLPPFKRILLTEDFSISEQIPLPYSEDPNGISYDFEKVFFYRDYLSKRLKYLAQDYIHTFHNYIRRELEEIEFAVLGVKSESKEEKRNLTLLQQRLNKTIDSKIIEIKSIINTIENFKFLPADMYNCLNIQLNDILKALTDPSLKSEKYFHIGKLCFNDFTSFEVAVFFYHLRDVGLFKYVSHAEFARFVESNFCTRNGDEFKSLTKIEDYFSELAKIRTDENALKKIKKYFNEIPSKH